LILEILDDSKKLEKSNNLQSKLESTKEKDIVEKTKKDKSAKNKK